MFVKAKKILASELMYAMEIDEDGAHAWLEEVLAKNGGKPAKKAPAAVAAGEAILAVSVWAILVAAGRGERLGDERPKAFARLGGRVLLAESLERLDRVRRSTRSSSSRRRNGRSR